MRVETYTDLQEDVWAAVNVWWIFSRLAESKCRLLFVLGSLLDMSQLLCWGEGKGNYLLAWDEDNLKEAVEMVVAVSIFL